RRCWGAGPLGEGFGSVGGACGFGSGTVSILVIGAGRKVFFSGGGSGFLSSTAAGAGAGFASDLGTSFRTLVSLMMSVGQAFLTVPLSLSSYDVGLRAGR